MVLRVPASSRPAKQCGSQLRDDFLFASEYLSLNHGREHGVRFVTLGYTTVCIASSQQEYKQGTQSLTHRLGSFGSIPRVVRSELRAFQDHVEARPDAYIRYDLPRALDTSREAIAGLLNVSRDTCVFVPNATTAVNTVLRNLKYQPGDVIIYFATIYGSCEKTVEYMIETTAVKSHKITFTYPVSDDFLCSAFEEAVQQVTKSDRTPRLAIFDTISALPGVRMPFERLTALCHKYKVLSLIDGAHGIGHIPLNLTQLDPDFFVSNCHKWLFTPKGSAVFYVPIRNQYLMRSTLPTSHGFVPELREGVTINNPLPPSAKSEFVNNFEFVGTIDSSPYLCVPAALAYRKTLTHDGLYGEEAILAYTHAQARQAGKLLATMFGTEILENEDGTLGNCNFSNVRLPLDFAVVAGGDFSKAVEIAVWMTEKMVEEYDTFMALIVYGDAWWVRLSAQVYLDMDDWKKGGEILSNLCQRVRGKKWT